MPSLNFEAEKIAFRDFYSDNAGLLDQAKDAFLTLLRSLLSHAGLEVAAATGRIKEREESIKKFTRKYQSELEKNATPYEIKDHITDLIGLRLVCLYEDQIEKVGDYLRKHFDLIEITDKTAEIEETENIFGYKGLHLDLRLGTERAGMPEYAPFRALSLRTPDPHYSAGLLEHTRSQDQIQEVDPSVSEETHQHARRVVRAG